MIRFARPALVLYVTVFLLAAFYASLLLLAAARGFHDATNTMIFGCGVIFIARACFAARSGMVRIRELEGEDPALLPWLTSDTVFAIGDVAAVGSLGLTAWAFWTNQNMMAAPVAPFGIGQAIAYPFYFAATFQRLRRQWAET